jgi:hypothetical protein
VSNIILQIYLTVLVLGLLFSTAVHVLVLVHVYYYYYMYCSMQYNVDHKRPWDAQTAQPIPTNLTGFCMVILSKMTPPHKVPLSLAKSWYFTSLAQLQMYSCVHSRNIRVYTVDLHSSFEWIRPRSRASSTSTIVNTQECTQSCEPTPVCWQVRQLRNLRKMIRKMVQLGNSAASTPKFS